MANNKQQSSDAIKLDNLFNKFGERKSDKNASTESKKENVKPEAKSPKKEEATTSKKAETKAPKKEETVAPKKDQTQAKSKAETTADIKTENKTENKTDSSSKAKSKAKDEKTTDNVSTASLETEAEKIKVKIPNKNLDKEAVNQTINDLENQINARKKAEEDLDRIARGTGSVVSKNNNLETPNNGNGNGNGNADAIISGGYSPKRNKLIAALAIIGLCLAGYATYQVSTLNIEQKLSNYQQLQNKVTSQSTNFNSLKQQVATLQEKLNQAQAKLTETENKLTSAQKDLDQKLASNTELTGNNQVAEQSLESRVQSLEKTIITNNDTISNLDSKINDQSVVLSEEQKALVNKVVNEIITSDEYKKYLESVILNYINNNPTDAAKSIPTLSQSTVDQIENLVNQKLKPVFDKNTAALEAAQTASQNAQSLATEAHNTAAQLQADTSVAQAHADKALAKATEAENLAQQASEQANQAKAQADQAVTTANGALASSAATASSVNNQSKELDAKAAQIVSDLKADLQANTKQVEQVVTDTKAYATNTLINQYLDLAQALIHKNAPAYQVVNELSIAYDLAKNTNVDLANTIFTDINYFQKVQLSSAQDLANIENELNQLAISSQDLPSLDATKFKAEVTKDASAFSKGLKGFINNFVKVNKVGDDDFIRSNAGILVNQTIQLKLNQALFALQNNNLDLYRSTLKEVINLLDTYYQNNDKQVQALRSAVETYLTYDFSYNNGYSLISLTKSK